MRHWAMCCLVACGCGTPPPPPERASAEAAAVKVAQPVPGSVKVLKGPEGVRVALVRLEDGTHLLRLRGTASIIDGKVLDYRVDDSSPRRRVFVTELDGRERWVLHVEGGRGTLSYRLYAPGDSMHSGTTLEYDEAGTTALDATELVRQHRAISADGTLERLRRFDRAAAERQVQAAAQKYVARLNEACRSQVKLDIDWDSVDDPTLKKYSIASYCRPPLDQLQRLCKTPAVAAAVAGTLRRVECRFEDAMGIALTDGTLRWTTFGQARNPGRYARRYLTEKAGFVAGGNLAKVLYRSKIELCSDDKSTYVGWRPQRKPEQDDPGSPLQVFYGDGKSFTLVPTSKWTGKGRFYDPRFINPTANKNFRGVDYRFQSALTIDRKAGVCVARCGTRKTRLRLLSAVRSQRLLKAASFKPPLARRQPYGLARDRRGNYFYVDRGPEKDSRDFRLYSGPVGKLKQLKMINIVADSRGDVFATRSGSLRLVLEKEHSYWVRRGKSRKLVNVPIQHNLGLVYNELGVYLGESYGTPCDIL